MKKTFKIILILLIYLSGCVASYSVGKKAITNNGKEKWTQRDRVFVVLISCTSWFGALVGGAVLLEKSVNLNEEANW